MSNAPAALIAPVVFGPPSGQILTMTHEQHQQAWRESMEAVMPTLQAVRLEQRLACFPGQQEWVD